MLETKSVTHFFLRCHPCTNIGIILTNDLNKISDRILHLIDDNVGKVLLLGDPKYQIK